MAGFQPVEPVFESGFGKRRRDIWARFGEMPPSFEMQRDDWGVRERVSERNSISRAHREMRRVLFRQHALLP